MTPEQLRQSGEKLARGLIDGDLRVVDVAPASGGEIVVTIRLSESIEAELEAWVMSA